jgi:hypothetical protein
MAKAAVEVPETKKSEAVGANGCIAWRKTSWVNTRSMAAMATKGIKKVMNPFVVHKNDVSAESEGGTFTFK